MIVEVPEAEPAVGEWRRRHAADAKLGIPAHVTLLFPFVPVSELGANAEEQLAKLLAATAPFNFVLACTGRFPKTLYLEPEPAAPFVRLTELLAAKWPEHPPYGGEFDSVVPHLTVAESEDESLLGRIAAEAASRLPIEATARSAQLYEEDAEGRWHERRRLPFAEAA